MNIPLSFRAALLCVFLSACSIRLQAQSITDSMDTETARQIAVTHVLDSLDGTLHYQYGKIHLSDVADLDMPPGYKFIPADRSQFLLEDIWGNPKDNSVLGMVVKNDYKLSKLDGWAFVVSYTEEGYVKDEDADKINYDDLLKDIQKSEEESNKERVKKGYSEIHLEGWASTPYYDKEHKVLHWAKKLKFSGVDDPVLNYDVRILGRKGVLSMNAVGGMDNLEDIKQHIPDILAMSTFTKGNKYSDFNPSMDKVAAYTIGGLIAGKLIAKTGLIVLLLKYFKLIFLVVAGGFATMRKRIASLFSRKKKDEDPTEHVAPAILENLSGDTQDNYGTTEVEHSDDSSTEVENSDADTTKGEQADDENKV